MKHTGQLGIVAALLGTLAVGTAAAQSSQNQQNQSNQQSAAKTSQSQNNQYSGVSQPPPDDTIQATEMDPQPENNPAPPTKPSPYVSATPTPAPATVPQQSAPETQPSPNSGTVFPSNPEAKATPGPDGEVDNTDDGIVTVAPPQKPASSDNDSQNPDFGIVTTVPSTTLRPGAWNPNNAIVNSVPVDPNALGTGINIPVRLSEELSTATVHRGELFRGVVTHDIYNGSKLVIPAGSEMRGTIVYVSQGHHMGIRAGLRLRPDVVLLPDGTAYHLYAEAIATQVPGVRVNDEGGMEATRHYRKDAIEYGAGTGVAAVAGAEIAGPVGAGVGSLVGAGLVTTHMLVQPPNALDLPENSVVIFSLTEPMPLIPTKN